MWRCGDRLISGFTLKEERRLLLDPILEGLSAPARFVHLVREYQQLQFRKMKRFSILDMLKVWKITQNAVSTLVYDTFLVAWPKDLINKSWIERIAAINQSIQNQRDHTQSLLMSRHINQKNLMMETNRSNPP